MTTPGDILAAIDVLSELSNEAAELPLEVAISLRDLLGQLDDERKRAANLIDTSVKRMLEQPKVIDNRKFEVKKSWATDYQHDEIGRLVIERIKQSQTNTATGEMPDMRPAIEAWRMFASLYLTNSTDAKKRALLVLLDIDDPPKQGVAKFRETGTKIVETPLEDT
jgi:hypothetical protein